MSVRRLDPVQPDSFAFTADNLAWAKKAIGNYPAGKQASAVLPILWRAQEQNDGWITKPAIEYVATMLDMAFIRVLEVATFYTMFQLSPVGKKAHIQVCGTTPCMLRGAEDLKKVCQRKIHHDPHHLSQDGDFSWEEVECLGACVNAPMVQIFKDTYEDLTPASLEKLIDDLASGRPVRPGPQIKRHLSAPEGGATTLTEKSLYNGERAVTCAGPKPATKVKAVAITNPAAPKPVKLPEQKIQPARKPAAKKPVAKKAAPAKKPAAKKSPPAKKISVKAAPAKKPKKK